MADMMDTLRSVLGENADEKIQNAMEMLKNSGINPEHKTNTENFARELENDIHTSKKNNNSLTDENLEFINQIRGMVNTMSNTNDQRSNLLRSLKPFMRSSRQQTIDKAIKIMNIGRFSGLFGKL